MINIENETIANMNNKAWFFDTSEWRKYLKKSNFNDTTINYQHVNKKNLNSYHLYSWNNNDLYMRYLFGNNKHIDNREIEYIICLANKRGYKKITSVGNHERLYKHKFLPIVNYTNIINLDNFKYRKSTKSEIQKAKKYDLCVEFETDYEKFKNDYYKIAGKKTRPEFTFQKLEEWDKLNLGKLFTVIKDNKNIAYVYVLYYKEKAYYFMSGIFEEYKKTGIGYLLQDFIIKYLKEIQIKYYETGDQEFLNLYNNNLTQKQINISQFKRSFGGEIKTVVSGELFLDKYYYEKTMIDRIKNYKEKLFI